MSRYLNQYYASYNKAKKEFGETEFDALIRFYPKSRFTQNRAEKLKQLKTKMDSLDRSFLLKSELVQLTAEQIDFKLLNEKKDEVSKQLDEHMKLKEEVAMILKENEKLFYEINKSREIIRNEKNKFSKWLDVATTNVRKIEDPISIEVPRFEPYTKTAFHLSPDDKDVITLDGKAVYPMELFSVATCMLQYAKMNKWSVVEKIQKSLVESERNFNDKYIFSLVKHNRFDYLND
jgi:hypothetical protein